MLEKLDTLQTEIESFRPLSPHALEQLRQFYRVGLTFTSNALEGNTLTESETKVVLEDGLTVSGKPIKDHLEAIGHADAFDWLWKTFAQERQDILTESTILELHQLVLRGQAPDQAGIYRNVQVFISGTDFMPPVAEEVPILMKALFETAWPVWRKNRHPVVAAALLHWKLLTVHPFHDGNGRVARLALNIALLCSGYGITQIPPVRRLDYISTLAGSRDASLSEKAVQPFIDFITEMVYESAKDYLRLLKRLK